MNFKLDKPTITYTFEYNDIVGCAEPGTFVESETGEICMVIRDICNDDILLHLNIQRPKVITDNTGMKFRVLEGYNTMTIGKS